jgi:hypothetical protein
MFRMDTNRRVATLAVVMVLALGSPLAAAGWEMPARWTDSGDFLKSFTRALAWLGIEPVPRVALKCDAGMSIDPNGLCSKALSGDRGSSIDPNGATTDAGMSIDPNGLH